MIIKELHLTNFTTHKNKSFYFSRGINSIVARNGRGKSSIINALGIALFNHNVANLKQLVSYGETTAEIKVLFLVAEREYTIVRKFGKTSATELLYDDVRIDGNVHVYEFLQTALDNMAGLYKTILYISSNNLTYPFLLEASKRKPLFDSIFGVDKYHLWWYDLRNSVRFIVDSINSLDNRISFESGRLNSIDHNRSKKDELEEKRNNLILQQTLYEENKTIIDKRNNLLSKIISLKKQEEDFSDKLIFKKEKRASVESDVCFTCGTLLHEDRKKSLLDLLDLEIAGLENSLTDLKKELAEYTLELKHLKALNFPDLSKDIAKLEGMLDSITESISDSDAVLKTLSELNVEKSKLSKKLEKLNDIRAKIKLMPELLIPRLMTRISRVATSKLSGFMDTNVEVHMSDTYELRITTDNGVLQFEQLSDGQKVLTAIATRLAIIECVAASSSIVFLDEPTINLDLEHRELLARGIKDTGFNQMFIVTHDDSFNPYVDNIILL